MDLKVKASGRSKTHYGLESSSDFRLQGAFLLHTYVLPYPLLRQGFASFVLAKIIPLRCLQETKTGYLPVSVVTSTSKRKWGWLYISQLEPTYVASGSEKKRPADCEFPTWSPSISYLTGSFNSGNENEIRIIPNTTHKNKLQIR